MSQLEEHTKLKKSKENCSESRKVKMTEIFHAGWSLTTTTVGPREHKKVQVSKCECGNPFPSQKEFLLLTKNILTAQIVVCFAYLHMCGPFLYIRSFYDPITFFNPLNPWQRWDRRRKLTFDYPNRNEKTSVPFGDAKPTEDFVRFRSFVRFVQTQLESLSLKQK